MLSALWSGVSGLNAFGNALSVIGGNIANINTVGYKNQRASFHEILSGVIMDRPQRIFSQGSIQNTNSPTDLAVDGRGFFVVSSDSGLFYTRAGLFNVDNQNRLVNPQGLVLQGWDLDDSGALSGGLKDVVLGNTYLPKSTSEFSFAANLYAGAIDGEIHTTTFSVYDSKGGKITLTIDFTYDDANTEWDWAASSSSGTTTSTGSITFDQNGELVPPGANPTISVTALSNGASDLALTWAMVAADGNTNLTSYDSSATTTYIYQNGYPTGLLQSISVNDEGVINGVFSNGQAKRLAKIALADFANPMGLVNLSGNIYAESNESGQAVLGSPTQGGRGSLMAGSLEMSNVDLAAELVNMIVTQRGFQANSRVITTSDEMMVEIVNLKR